MATKTVRFYATQLTSYYGTSGNLGRSSAGEGGTHSFTVGGVTYTGYFAGLRSSSSNRYGTKIKLSDAVSEEGYKLSDVTFGDISSVKFSFIRKPCYVNNTYGVSLYYTILTGDVAGTFTTGNAVATTNRVSFSAAGAPSSTQNGTVTNTLSLTSTKWTQLKTYGMAVYFGSTSGNARHVFIGDVWIDVTANFPDLDTDQPIYGVSGGSLKLAVPYVVSGGKLVKGTAGIVTGPTVKIF